MEKKAYLAIKPKNKTIEKEPWMTTYVFSTKEKAQKYLDMLCSDEQKKSISQSRIYFGEEEEKLKALAYVGSSEMVSERMTDSVDPNRVILERTPKSERPEGFHSVDVLNAMKEEARKNMENQTGRKRKKREGYMVKARNFGNQPIPYHFKLSDILNQYWMQGVSAVKLSFVGGKETTVVLRDFYYLNTNAGMIAGKRLRVDDVKELSFEKVLEEAKKLGSQGEVLEGLAEMTAVCPATKIEMVHNMIIFPSFGPLYANIVEKNPVKIQYQHKADAPANVMMSYDQLLSVTPVSMRLEVTDEALIESIARKAQA